MDPMPPPDGRDPTYEDLRAYPEKVHAEIIDGRIVVTAESPLPRHSKAQVALSHLIGGPFDVDDGFGGPGGWWIFADVDVQLGKHVVRPDLAGWRRERLTDPHTRPISMNPDWVVEIVSPSNEAHDRVTKRRIYAAQGVSHYWIVDPEERTLEALTLESKRWVDAGSFDETANARIIPFEAVELPVGRLFLPRATT